MTRFFALIFSVMAFLAAPAFGADPFTVSGVKVDATARSAIEAQTIAMRDGQIIAAERLFNRITLESERVANPLPELTPEIVARFIRSLEPSKEKRSANRYLGEVSVAFNPSQIQQFLRENNLTLVSSQARERLVIVTGQSGLRGGFEDGVTLQSAFSDPRLSHALTPLRAAAPDDALGVTSGASASELAGLAAKYGLTQILIVEPSGNVTEISTDTGERESFFISGVSDPVGFADRVIARLESEWKQAAAVTAGEAVTTTVSVLYNSHAEWLDLQEAINTSAQIRGARLDALSRDGALMTISYGGDINRLATELRFKGVTVERHPALGLVFKSS